MAIKIKNLNQIRREIQSVGESIENDIIEAMKKAGEDFVTEAREMKKSKGGFGDRSGNLRSSIGYAILKDGKLIFGDFKGKNPEGVSVAKNAINQIEKKNGFQMICVAGMEYASIVESKGMNVISVQAEILLVDLKEYIGTIKRKYQK